MENLELVNLVVAKDLELYKTKEEFKALSKENIGLKSDIEALRGKNESLEAEINNLKKHLERTNKRLREAESYLDQITSPDVTVKAKYRPDNRIMRESELKEKYEGASTVQPYLWYKRRGMEIPEWARECYRRYSKEQKNKNLVVTLTINNQTDLGQHPDQLSTGR